MSTSLLSQRLSNKHFWTALISIFVISLILIAFYPNRKPVEETRTAAHLPAFGGFTDDTSFGHIIDALYRPYIHPITAPDFTDAAGETFRLEGEPYYTEGLGKRVLILDADTRPMTDDGQLISKGGMKWPNPEPMAAGMLSHYLYGKLNLCKARKRSSSHVLSKSLTGLTCSKNPWLRLSVCAHRSNIRLVTYMVQGS